MITPISEAGRSIIRQFSDEEAKIPAVLKTFIYSSAELIAGESRDTTMAEKRTDVLKRYM